MMKEPEDKNPDEDEDQNKKLKGKEQYTVNQKLHMKGVVKWKLQNSDQNIKI